MVLNNVLDIFVTIPSGGGHVAQFFSAAVVHKLSTALAAADNLLRLELVSLHFARLCMRNFGQTHESVPRNFLTFEPFIMLKVLKFEGEMCEKSVRR